MTFTAKQKRECAEREAKMREQVYPRRVQNRQITREFADEQIALMRAIADDYRKFEEAERLI